MLPLDADNDDNEDEEEENDDDDDDDDISRDKLGFTTSAGGHLLPLHNHNLWRELVGWRLSTGEGWRETKNILGRRGGEGEKHKILFLFQYEVGNMKRDSCYTWMEVGGVERDKEKGSRRRGGEEVEKRWRRKRDDIK